MQTETIYQNDVLVTVPLGFKELSARKLQLDRITDGDKAVMSDLYNALAEEFEAIEYYLIGAACRKRAGQWAQMK